MGGGGPPATQLAAMTERSGVTIIILTFVTCGIYYFIWKYQTTQELKNATGDKEMNPGLDLLLSILLCGIWAVFTDYRNAKKAYETLKANGSNRGDQSTIVILLHFLGLGFVSIYMLQEEYNAIAKLGRGGQLALDEATLLQRGVAHCFQGNARGFIGVATANKVVCSPRPVFAAAPVPARS